MRQGAAFSPENGWSQFQTQRRSDALSTALLSPLGNAGLCESQCYSKGRGKNLSAFAISGLTPSLPLQVPSLPGHSLYMVTTSGSSEITFRDSIEDLIELSSWLVVAFSVTPGHRNHVHYLALLPSDNERWLSRHPQRWLRGRRLPQVRYCRCGDEYTTLTFSKVFNLEGVVDYLRGPQNRAAFFVIKDTLSRWRAPVPGPYNNYKHLHNHLETFRNYHKEQLYRVVPFIEECESGGAAGGSGREGVDAVCPWRKRPDTNGRRRKTSLIHGRAYNHPLRKDAIKGNNNGSLSRPAPSTTRRLPVTIGPRSGYS